MSAQKKKATKPSPDPIKSLYVWLNVDANDVACGIEKPSTGEGWKRHPYRAEPKDYKVLTEGDGFDAYVFDNELRWRGFLAGVMATEPYGTDEPVAVWTERREIGLFMVVLHGSGDTHHKWNDMRDHNKVEGGK